MISTHLWSRWVSLGRTRIQAYKVYTPRVNSVHSVYIVYGVENLVVRHWSSEMLFITSNTLFGSQKQFLSWAILQMQQLHLGRKFETTIDVFMCTCLPAPQSGQNVCFAFFGNVFKRKWIWCNNIFHEKNIWVTVGIWKDFTSGQHYNLFEVVRWEIEFGAIVIMRKGENWVNEPISACLWIEDKIAEFSICQKSLFEQVSIFRVARGKCSYRLKSKIKDRLNEETVYFLYFQSACICMSVTLSMKSCLIERDVYLVSVMTVGDARGVNYTFQLTHSLGRGGTLFRRVVSSHRSKVENSEYVRC